MNIFNTKFEKKIKKKQNEYTLKINLLLLKRIWSQNHRHAMLHHLILLVWRMSWYILFVLFKN